MITLSILFPPNISPVAVSIGNFDIHWYSLAYILGITLGLYYIKLLTSKLDIVAPVRRKIFFDDLLFYIVIGIILGGRLGFVFFYNFSYYIANPLQILFLWQGGMSYHGGLLGVVFSCYLFSKKYSISVLQVTDLIAIAAPIGLFFGRVANFINGELYGHPTTLPWGVIFPNVLFPRHPSQLYEALLEGVVLGTILFILWYKKYYKTSGFISANFLIFYGSFRIIVEFFREGEIYFFNAITMGQILSLPMIIIGVFILYYVKRKDN